MYSPQFSDLASVTVRRLAWAIGASMPAAVDRMVKLLPTMYDPGFVCQRCQDQTKCRLCGFRSKPGTDEQASLLSM